MKESFIIQLNQGETELATFKDEAKKMWKSEGNKVKDIKSMNFYLKPEENKCYYLINEDFQGSVDLV